MYLIKMIFLLNVVFSTFTAKWFKSCSYEREGEQLFFLFEISFRLFSISVSIYLFLMISWWFKTPLLSTVTFETIKSQREEKQKSMI